MTDQNAIFVSYAWGGESERTVDELEQAFAAQGLSIRRDKKALGYKGSIEAFEERIGRGRAVILVISDKYLRSKHCMYELVAAAENQDLRARIFPIVLADAKIYDAVDRLAYIQHWDAEIAELNQAIKNVAVVAHLKGITNDLDLYDRIRDRIAELTDLLSDMNTLTPEIHAASGYATLIETIQAETNKLETQEEETMSGSKDEKSSNINTSGGTFIGGSVNTGGGDFVGRDKVTQAQSGGIAIGGNVTGSTIITGNHNLVGSTVNLQAEYIQQILAKIEKQPDLHPDDKADLKAAVQEIQEEDGKGNEADESFIARRLRNIRRTAPDILEVVLTTIGNPSAGFGLVARKVAEKMKADAGV